MENTGKKSDEWTIVDWRVVAQKSFSFSRLWGFAKNRVPQVFVIWAVVAALLRVQAFVDVFGWFGRRFNSPFFLVGSVGASQPVDLTPFFLIGFAALSCALSFAAVLYCCIKLCHLMNMSRPVKFEQAFARFADKMTDEVSSSLAHCSAATVALLVSGNPERYGDSVFHWCTFMAVFMLILGGICYREN